MATTAKPAAAPAPAAAQPGLAPCEYKTGKTLGHGSYATVKEAVQIKTGKRYAVKVISKQLMRGKEAMILNEIEVLKKVSRGHGNIVTLWDYFETPNNLYLVMDLCTGGELFDRICEKGSYYESDAADIVRTVVSAIQYLHSQNIVHRDIKAENLLFKARETSDPQDLVIADFGLSKMMDDEKAYMLMTTCGTPGYMAPEVIKRTGHNKPVDMWSLGVLTYFLLCGYTPFDANTQAEEIQNILKAKFAFEPKEYWEDVSEEAKDFIRNLLIVASNKRLTPEQALAHPWLNRQTEAVVPSDEMAMDMGLAVPDFGSSMGSVAMTSFGSSATLAGGAVAAALASGMDNLPSPTLPTGDLERARPDTSPLPPLATPSDASTLPPSLPMLDSSMPAAAGIAIPSRKPAAPTIPIMLGASAPPDVIYAMMNSLATSRPGGLPLPSYDDTAGSLPGVSMLSQSVAPFGMSQTRPNLINHVRYNFSARRTFRRAVDTVKVANRLQHFGRDSPSRGTLSKSTSANDLLQVGSGDIGMSRDNSTDSMGLPSGRAASPNLGVLPKPDGLSGGNSPDSEMTTRDASSDNQDLLKTRSDGTLLENADAMEVDA